MSQPGKGTRVLAAFLFVAPAACVLVDPPPTLPPVPVEPPYIETASVVPSTSQPLTTWPDSSVGFVIPVQLVDQTRTVKWIGYIDPNTAPNNGQVAYGPFAVPPDDGGTLRIIHANITEPLGFGCHTIEVVVAYDFDGTTPVIDAGASVSPASVVSWLYTSSGNPGDCTPYEAGTLTTGVFPDGGT